MRLKFTLLSVLFASFFLTSNAQIEYGVKAGWNYTSAIAKTNSGESLKTSSGDGFHAGFQMKLPFEKNLYFSSGLLFSKKSYSVFSDNFYKDSASSTDYSIFYTEIPVFLHYQTSTNVNHFFIEAGPSFSLAVKGEETINYMNGTAIEQPMKFAFTDYGRFEANLAINIGYQFRNRMQIYAGYYHGLGSIVDDDAGPVIKPRMISIGAGYYFGRKNKSFRVSPLDSK